MASGGRHYNMIELDVTPDDLRGWADRLEAMWAKTSIGQEVPRIAIRWTSEWRVDLVADQERLRR